MGIRLRYALSIKHNWALANVAITITVKMTGLKNESTGGIGNDFTVTPLSTFSNEISHPADMVCGLFSGADTERLIPDPHKICLESGSGLVNSKSKRLDMIRQKKMLFLKFN